MVAIDARSFSLKVHLTSDPDRCLVDVVRKALVDWVVLKRLVYEQLVVHFFLQLVNDNMQPFYFLVFVFAVLKQLDTHSLGLLALFFDLEEFV